MLVCVCVHTEFNTEIKITGSLNQVLQQRQTTPENEEARATFKGSS